MFNIFRQDSLINELTDIEKQIIFNHIVYGIIDEQSFNFIKEYIPKHRAFNHPTYGYL